MDDKWKNNKWIYNHAWDQQTDKIFQGEWNDCNGNDQDKFGRFYEMPRYCGRSKRMVDFIDGHDRWHTGPSSSSMAHGYNKGFTCGIIDDQVIFNQNDIQELEKGPDLILINACTGDVVHKGSGWITNNFNNIPPNHYVLFGTHGNHEYDIELGITALQNLIEIGTNREYNQGKHFNIETMV